MLPLFLHVGALYAGGRRFETADASAFPFFFFHFIFFCFPFLIFPFSLFLFFFHCSPILSGKKGSVWIYKDEFSQAYEYHVQRDASKFFKMLPNHRVTTVFFSPVFLNEILPFKTHGPVISDSVPVIDPYNAFSS
jgi:hypothetical protein